jgi:hypothetical protein
LLSLRLAIFTPMYAMQVKQMLERRLRRGKNEEKVFHLFTPGSRELIKRDFAFEA